MHWTANRPGRSVTRPSYSADELDQLSEQLITTFLAVRHHHVAFPVATDDLIVLVEHLGGTLEWAADPAADERVIHGCTDFTPGCRPLVRVARWLFEHPRDEPHGRTTLAHACGHVWLHRPTSGARPKVGPFVRGGHHVTYHCRLATMLHAPRSDRAEWQAGYVAGALLMPISRLRAVLQGRFPVDSPVGRRLVREVRAAFAVSKEAARARLLQRGVLTEEPVRQGELFA